MDPVSEVPTEADSADRPGEVWSPFKKLALRVALIYFALSFVPEFFALDFFLDPLRALATSRFWGLDELPVGEDTGSGDRLVDVIAVVVNLLLTAFGATLWSLLDRKRPNYRWVYEALRVMLRYALALTLMSYGFVKLRQFPPISHAEMVRSIGSETPMGVLWNFMGASPAYTVFSGVLEVLGGVLLLFRRTTTLSALVVVPVMMNVFILNLCYDVPVKLMSFHLLVAAIVLTLPDARRLLDVLVFNRPTAPRELVPVIRYPKIRIGVLIVKWLCFGNVIWGGAGQALESWRELQRPRSPFVGIWKVVRFERAGREMDTVSLRNPVRWDLVVIDPSRAANLRIAIDLVGGETRKGTLSDVTEGELSINLKPEPERWTYERSGETLILRGNPGAVATKVELRKATAEFPLMDHQIHWIQERPRTP
ncbi:hypothetical protein EON79_01240 [bacterium]|nr:MAG: hypothetical protein EON79_01240 [bacterium]